MDQGIQCHYEILNVPRDADATAIRKAHRRLALQYHPDKNYGDDGAAKRFQLVQQAYECLSDAAERKWYDEHRDVILRGGKVGTAGGGDDGEEGGSYLFDIAPYRFPGCYSGYGDGEDGFFSVFREVFRQVIEGEREGWIGEGNIDEKLMPNYHLLPTGTDGIDFGDGSTAWSEVSTFYSEWESFTSCLSFAWADRYDIREVESRWQKRKVDEENKKARRIARRERNEEIVGLVAFVKRRDPRVKTARKLAEEAKREKERLKRDETLRKKAETAKAKEAWLLERKKEMEEAQEHDLNAGRIRLADLDDSDDDYSYKKGKKKKGRRGKKKGKGKKSQWSSDSESQHEEDVAGDDNDGNDDNDDNDDSDDNTDVSNTNETRDATLNHGVEYEQNDPDITIGDADADSITNSHETGATQNSTEEQPTCKKIEDSKNEESSYVSEEEEEPVIWRCECCRKDFKSDNQLNNHLKSKKHKAQHKKFYKL